MAYLDWQVTQWYNSVPEFLKISNPAITSTDILHDQLNQQDGPRITRRLKALLYLRANLMKILIYRPILYTPSQIAQSPVEASTVVDIAKNIICFITHLNNSTDIYQLQQITFNWFLISALAVLFLAVAHAPAQFTSACKDEFYMALGLIEGFSMHSYISQRLWKSVKGLRKLGPKIGLPAQKGAEKVVVRARRQSLQRPAPPAPPAPPQQQQQQQKQPEQSVDDYPGTTTINPIPQEGGGGGIPAYISPPTEHHHQQPPLSSSLQVPPAPPTATTTTSTLTDLQPSPDDFLLTNGTQMSRELMDWFEAMGEPNNGIYENLNNGTNNMNLFNNAENGMMIIDPAAAAAGSGANGAGVGWNGILTDTTSWPATDDLMFGYGSDLANILKDCF